MALSKRISIEARLDDDPFVFGNMIGFIGPRREKQEDADGEDDWRTSLDQEENAPVGDGGFDVRNSEGDQTAESANYLIVSISSKKITAEKPTYAPESTPAPINSASRFDISSFLYQSE